MDAYGRWRWLFEERLRNENEERIFKAICENDVEALKGISTNLAGCRFGHQDTPILSFAVAHRDCAVVKYLLDCGCDIRDIDQHGHSALNMLFWCPLGSFDNEKRQLEIADILLAKHSNAVEAVFLIADRYKATPFLHACAYGCDLIILRFLALLDTTSISMDHVIDCDGDNLFHHILDNCRGRLTPIRLETVRALIDKFPYSNQLIVATNNYGKTPLRKLLLGNRSNSRVTRDSRDVIALVNLFFQRGALSDIENPNVTMYLNWAIWSKNESVFETILRAGYRTYKFDHKSPLFFLVLYARSFRPQSVRMIELLLAFGHDLQKELFLYTIEERPIEFTSQEYANRRDTRGMDPEVLEVLRELRRSNKMLSLQRQCRNTIRRHFKDKADEILSNLTCIPDRIKSFLLVENEMQLF